MAEGYPQITLTLEFVFASTNTYQIACDGLYMKTNQVQFNKISDGPSSHRFQQTPREDIMPCVHRYLRRDVLRDSQG
jgi:hypothetical protein